MSVISSQPGIATAVTLSMPLPRKRSTPPRDTGLGPNTFRLIPPLYWLVSSSSPLSQAVNVKQLKSIRHIIHSAGNLYVLFISVFYLKGYSIGTTRMLSIIITGLQSFPSTPPAQTKNVNPVSIVLSKVLSHLLPSCVLLNSDRFMETVVHLPPVSYEPVFFQGNHKPRGTFVSLK